MTPKINHLPATLVLFLCLAFTVAIYYPGLAGGFVFDDFANLLLNKKLQLDTLDFDSLMSASLSSNAGVLKRPVSMFTFALNSYFSGQDPYSYKVVNLLIHLLTGIGIFLLTRLVLQHYYKSRQLELHQRTLYWLPLFISCVWLVHPINLTSVLYVIQRMTSLASLFTIFGVCLYIWSRSRQIEYNRGFWQIPLGIAAFGSLAIFSKESGALLALFLLLVEVTLFRFKNHNGETDYKIAGLFIVIIVLPTIGVIISLIYTPDLLLGGYTYRDFTLTERIMTEARVLIFYLKMLLLPTTTELGLFHDDIPVSRSLITPLSTIPSIATILGLFSLGLILLRKHPLLGFGILWFFIGHVLESTILPLEIAHEHRNYLASFGFIFCISYLFVSQSFIEQKKFLRYTIVIATIGVMSTVTALRAYQWSDTTLHAKYEAEHHPDSPRAVFEAGRIYANLTLYADIDKAEDALRMLERSRLLNKIDILPNISLIMLSYKLDKPIKAIWLEEAKEKLISLPIRDASIAALGELVKCQGYQCKLSKEDMESLFKHALNNTSTHESEHHNPDILITYAYHALNNNNDYNLGYNLFREAIEISPNNIQYRVAFIDLLLILKQYDSARAQLTYIQENNPVGKHNAIIKKIEGELDNLTAQ